MRLFFFITVFSLCTNITIGQTKSEREVTLKKKDVPKNILHQIADFKLHTKIKWFKEFSNSNIKIEAKFKYHNKFYSVEFDTLGNLEDIEKRIDFNSINSETRTTIVNELTSLFNKYSIQKTQIQYIGSYDILKRIFSNSSTPNELIVNYECIVNTRYNNMFTQFECLFSQDGKLIKKEQLVSDSRNELEY